MSRRLSALAAFSAGSFSGISVRGFSSRRATRDWSARSNCPTDMASESPRTVNGFLVFLGSAAAFVIVTLLAVIFLAANRPAGQTLEDKRAAQRREVRAKLDKEAEDKIGSA